MLSVSGCNDILNMENNSWSLGSAPSAMFERQFGRIFA